MIYLVILFFLLKYIIDKIFEENVIFNYFKHINVSDSDDDLMNVYIIKEDNYIPKEISKIRKYDLLELASYKRKRKHHRKIIREIISEKKDCLIIGNMVSPNDYFELVGSLLVNGINAKISIVREDDIKYYFEEDYKVCNILREGGNYSVGVIKENGNMLIVDKGETNFYKNIKTKYFEIDLYKIKNSKKYAVSILWNPLKLDNKNLYNIAQLHL